MIHIKTMIIEDDFKVAEINKQFTEQVEGFEVVELSGSAEKAMEYLASHKVDLIILDIYLPDMLGTELLKLIRKKEYPVDIITITAAHDSRTIESSLRLGIFDFIIKPFAFDRYRDSLLKYREYKTSLQKNTEYDQQKVNALISFRQNTEGPENLPKGITLFTLEQIREVIDSLHLDFSIDDVLAKVSFSKITARKYLEYLNQAGFITKSFKYKKIGRPVVVYSKPGPVLNRQETADSADAGPASRTH